MSDVDRAADDAISFDVALRYLPVLRRYARRFTRQLQHLSAVGDFCDSEDLVQETYARAFSRWQRPGARPRATSAVQAWLHLIMLRIWQDRARKVRGRLPRVTPEHDGEDTRWDAYLSVDPRDAILTRLDVERGLASLPPARRELLASVAAGESRQDIARREGIERVTVDARVWRARAAMERALAEPEIAVEI